MKRLRSLVSGIGLARVQRLLTDGSRVGATTREPAKPSSLRSQYAGRLFAEALDITDPQRINDVVKRAVITLGGAADVRTTED